MSAPVGHGLFVIQIIESERRFSGRLFEPTEEMALHRHVQILLRGMAGKSSKAVAVWEFIGPFGVADLVVLVVDGEKLTARLGAGVPPILNEVDAGIVATLTPFRGKAISDVAERWPIAVEKLERRVQRLVGMGAIRRTPSGRLVRHEALTSLGRLHALELKVRDWRQAFDQARTYALWADTSSAVLARLPRERERVHQAALSARVGLALADEWLSHPPVRRHAPSRRFWASEHFVAASRDSLRS